MRNRTQPAHSRRRAANACVWFTVWYGTMKQSWLGWFYKNHPEYKHLRMAKRSACSIHFELEPNLYEAYFQIKPIFHWSAFGLAFPSEQIAAVGRMVKGVIYNPQLARQMVRALPFATIITLPNPTSDGIDSSLSDSNPANNYGTSSVFQNGTLGNWCIIMRWDLTSIPVLAIPSIATFSIVNTVSRSSNRGPVNIYQLAAANADFPEGTKDNALAVAGDCSWNLKNASGITWAGSAGCMTATTDYINTILGAWNYIANSPAGTTMTTTLNATGLVAIKSSFGSTFSFLGRDQGTAIFNVLSATSDHATAAYRPLLTVTYSLPAGGGVFQSSFGNPFG